MPSDPCSDELLWRKRPEGCETTSCNTREQHVLHSFKVPSPEVKARNIGILEIPGIPFGFLSQQAHLQAFASWDRKNHPNFKYFFRTISGWWSRKTWVPWRALRQSIWKHHGGLYSSSWWRSYVLTLDVSPNQPLVVEPPSWNMQPKMKIDSSTQKRRVKGRHLWNHWPKQAGIEPVNNLQLKIQQWRCRPTWK